MYRNTQHQILWNNSGSAASKHQRSSSKKKKKSKKQDKKDGRPASAVLGKKDDGKDGGEEDGSDSSDIVMKPMDVTDLKTKAFVVTTREKKEDKGREIRNQRRGTRQNGKLYLFS